MAVIVRRGNGFLTVHNLGQETITNVRAVGVGILALSLGPGPSVPRRGCEAVQHVLYVDASGAQQRISVRDD